MAGHAATWSFKATDIATTLLDIKACKDYMFLVCLHIYVLNIDEIRSFFSLIKIKYGNFFSAIIESASTSTASEEGPNDTGNLKNIYKKE